MVFCTGFSRRLPTTSLFPSNSKLYIMSPTNSPILTVSLRPLPMCSLMCETLNSMKASRSSFVMCGVRSSLNSTSVCLKPARNPPSASVRVFIFLQNGLSM